MRQPDSPIVLAGFRSILHSCLQCGNPVPINGVVQTLACPSCDAPVHVPAVLWAKTFRALTLKHIRDREPSGRAGAVECADPSGRGMLRSEFSVLPAPLCVHCASPMPAQAAWFDQPAFAMPCPTCGKGVSFARPAVELPRSALLLTHIAGTEVELSAAPAPPVTPNATKPVIFQCPACSASLPIDANSKRTLTCRYCEASVYLPDGLWRELHPIKTAHTWTAVFRLQPDVLRSEAKAGCLGMAIGLSVLEILPGVFFFIGLSDMLGISKEEGALVFFTLGCLGLVIGVVVMGFILNGLRRELAFAENVQRLANRG